jgi:hypothetical protein
MTNDAVSEVYYCPIHCGELWGGAPTERPGGGTPSPIRTDKARITEWSKPDAVVCTKRDEMYECAVKAGVVC